MPEIKCKMCGGKINFPDGATTAECEYCMSTQTLPHISDEKAERLYDRANHFRRNNEFDKAMAIYEQILDENNEDSEAYWSLVLCRYGIEYVTDPQTKRKVPTVNRTQYTSIYDDENYISALKYADISQRSIYEREAKEINELQRGILEISQNEAPFDVFICYKETDENGQRTHDSTYANELYHMLCNEGLKVFYARITLEDKIGMAYEPYIFAALNSAKAMIVLGTKKEYFEAPWVKNEWSRYLALVKCSAGKKVLIPAYKDMDPYDVPEEFSHLQAQDMNRLGSAFDIVRGIKKVVGAAAVSVDERPEKQQSKKQDTVNADALLRRIELFLSNGEWDSANAYCEKVLDTDPENSKAYVYKLCSELRARDYSDLNNCTSPLDTARSYKNVIRFADDATARHITELNRQIRERLRKAEAYNKKYAEIEELRNNAANVVQSYEQRLQNLKSYHRQREYDISRDAQRKKKTKRLAVSLLIWIFLLIFDIVAACVMAVRVDSDSDGVIAFFAILVMAAAVVDIVILVLSARLLYSDGKSVGIIILNFLFCYDIIAIVTAFKSLSKYSKKNISNDCENQLYSLNAEIQQCESELERQKGYLAQYTRDLSELN